MNQALQPFIISPNMLLIRDHKILLLRRASWAPLWPSYWHCPCGKMERDESPLQTAIREAYEEVGLQVSPQLGTIVEVRTRNFKNPDLIYKDISLFFVAKDFEGDPFNKEPRLHDAVEWFDIHHLPDPIIPVVKHGIKQYTRGETYGEFRDPERTTSLKASLTFSDNIRKLSEKDIPIITSTFAEIGCNKPASLYQQYLKEQENNRNSIWVALRDGDFAGYMTLKWHSEYASFREQGIPEISDLNVLPRFRKQGIASKLLDVAEDEAREKSSIVGIGVGLSADYGVAQKLYVRRGYLPDGKGITYKYKPVSYDSTVCLDDDLVLWFMKRLS